MSEGLDERLNKRMKEILEHLVEFRWYRLEFV